MKRGRCLFCGDLTDTRRYVVLRVAETGAVAQLPWYTRRVCDECAGRGRGVRSTVVLEAIEVREAAEYEEQAPWE